MRVKREYLTPELPKPETKIIERVVEKPVVKVVKETITDPVIIKKLARIEALVRDIMALGEIPEEKDPALDDILTRVNALHDRLERLAKAPPPAPPPPPKQAYQFDVVRNKDGNLERIVARPIGGDATIYGSS